MSGKDLDALRAAAQKRDFRPVPLGVTVSTRFANQVRRRPTANVLGLLPGSDPKLSQEVVLYTAHHDHLGMKDGGEAGRGRHLQRRGGQRVRRGGDAGGGRGLHRAAQGAARSILFAAVAAEEQGLLGSQYLAEHLPVPAGRVAANINIDGLNIHGPHAGRDGDRPGQVHPGRAARWRWRGRRAAR